MKAKEILLTGVAGTTFMTLFSYLVSLAAEENFSEPERLGQLAHRLIPKLDEEQSQTLGWLGHYAVGLLFAMVYVELWRSGKLKPDWKTGLWLGGLSGLFAVAVWKATLVPTRCRRPCGSMPITCNCFRRISSSLYSRDWVTNS